MSIKLLQLDLVLVSIFKKFVEFSHSSAIVKIAVTNENLVETNISKVSNLSLRSENANKIFWIL